MLNEYSLRKLHSNNKKNYSSLLQSLCFFTFRSLNGEYLDSAVSLQMATCYIAENDIMCCVYHMWGNGVKFV